MMNVLEFLRTRILLKNFLETSHTSYMCEMCRKLCDSHEIEFVESVFCTKKKCTFRKPSKKAPHGGVALDAKTIRKRKFSP